MTLRTSSATRRSVVSRSSVVFTTSATSSNSGSTLVCKSVDRAVMESRTPSYQPSPAAPEACLLQNLPDKWKFYGEVLHAKQQGKAMSVSDLSPNWRLEGGMHCNIICYLICVSSSKYAE